MKKIGQFIYPWGNGHYTRMMRLDGVLAKYLNEDFDGGETSFIDGEIKPKTGLAAFMTQHNYLHEAKEATNGTKYVLRTDVMYRKKIEE